jgi:hypothetical protein
MSLTLLETLQEIILQNAFHITDIILDVKLSKIEPSKENI